MRARCRAHHIVLDSITLTIKQNELSVNGKMTWEQRTEFLACLLRLMTMLGSSLWIRIQNYGMDGVCSTNGRPEKCAQIFGRKSIKKKLRRPKCSSEDNIKKNRCVMQYKRMLTGLTWLKMRSLSDTWEQCNERLLSYPPKKNDHWIRFVNMKVYIN